MGFFKLGPDEASEKMLKMRASFGQMTNDISNNSVSAKEAASMADMTALANAMAAAAAAPASEAKFCMYCGSKLTGKFCSNCGAQCRS